MPEQERAQVLLNGNKLRDWLTSPYSRILLVEGNAEHLERMSVLSFASALLFASMEGLTDATRVIFFCGQHVDLNDPEDGARVLMNGFVGQLTTQYKFFEYSCLGGKSVAAQLEPGERLDTLCKMFRSMVEQLPAKETIFCIIEGIKYYEHSTRLPDLLKVLKMLKELTVSKHVKAAVKVLVVNETRSVLELKQLFKDNEMLRLPLNVAPRGQGLTAGRYQQDIRDNTQKYRRNSRPEKMNRGTAHSRGNGSEEDDDEEHDSNEDNSNDAFENFD